MELSLSEIELVNYVSKQLDNFYPDGKAVTASIQQCVGISLQRLEYCFKHVSSKRYFNGNNTYYNHLYSDHNILLLWFLSNSVWKETGNDNLASKLYYLNKSLHGFDCMYNTELPDIFLVFHGVGTMLGKASYSDFFVALQGCTIGSHKGAYPILGKGVSLTANSSVIGNCTIGDRVNIATGVLVFDNNIENDSTIYRNNTTGANEIKRSNLSYAQQFFNVDLKQS
jgi:serine O-acetyltransferase